MATLTIRDLDESLKRNLRMRAASRNRSMEEEARQILRAALSELPAAPALDMAARIRARVAGLGDVKLAIPAREPIRPPPNFNEATVAARTSKSKAPVRSKRRA